jgi:hypothetical protein
MTPDMLEPPSDPPRYRLEGHWTDPSNGQTTLMSRASNYEPESQTKRDVLRLETITQAGNMEAAQIDLVMHQYFPRELELLFHLAGLEVTHRFGDHHSSPFGRESDVLILVGRPTT